MNTINELISERKLTEWNGARVDVIIEVPQHNNSMTSRMIIDRRDLEQLKYLKMPESLEMLMSSYPAQAKCELIKYETERKKAERIVERIAGEIANHLTRSIGGEF